MFHFGTVLLRGRGKGCNSISNMVQLGNSSSDVKLTVSSQTSAENTGKKKESSGTVLSRTWVVT